MKTAIRNLTYLTFAAAYVFMTQAAFGAQPPATGTKASAPAAKASGVTQPPVAPKAADKPATPPAAPAAEPPQGASADQWVSYWRAKALYLQAEFTDLQERYMKLKYPNEEQGNEAADQFAQTQQQKQMEAQRAAQQKQEKK